MDAALKKILFKVKKLKKHQMHPLIHLIFHKLLRKELKVKRVRQLKFLENSTATTRFSSNPSSASWALSESKQFALAAFRFDQAISAGAEDSALREAAEAYVAAGDLYSASERYSDYLVINNEDGQSWVKFGRILSKINKPQKQLMRSTKELKHLLLKTVF